MTALAFARPVPTAPRYATPLQLLAGPVLLAALIASRGLLEASMLQHMLVQLPLLVVGGVLCRPWFGRWRLIACDVQGLAGLTAMVFVTSYWMIPRALEQSLVAPLAEVLKFASLLLLGLVLPGSLRRAHVVVQLFFVANVCAMMAIAGMLYQDMPQRLCNAYLLDDQGATGGALVGLALALAVAWCGAHWRQVVEAAEPDGPAGR